MIKFPSEAKSSVFGARGIWRKGFGFIFGFEMAIEAQLYSENQGFPLFGSQDWVVENGGCGNGGFTQFCFNVQHKHQLQQQQQQQQQLQSQQQMNLNLGFENSFLVPTLENSTSTNSIMASYSQTMEAQAAKQRQEIDEYIRLQNERLRLVLQQQTKQQLAMLLKKIESKTLVMLKQKDDEITQVNQRRMELEDYLRKLESENLAWQRVAQDNEAMVVSLNNTLEQFKQKASCCFINGAEDAQSCFGSTQDEDEREEAESKNGGFGENQRLKTMSVCRSCNSRSSCVLFLPCRHLCSCKACEAVLDCCPVCSAPKKASIEALII